ncbi:uncharacterized protein [Mytilus edulis]|uniref:uncharacterized protein n=1 Tax=Mytilus edulis TaxID=6550 RepID=UPI0039F0F269
MLSLKSKSQRFYNLNNHTLEQVSSNPYLGLQIQEDLKWKEQITNTCNKASSTLGFLRRNLQHCPMECRKTAYIALIRSIMEYGSIIWDPYTQKDIDKLESIQKRGARFITKDYKSREEGCMTKMLKELQLLSLQSRRQQQRLIFFFKVVERKIPALPPDDLIQFHRPKRQIKATTYNNFVTKNIIDHQVRNNKRAVIVPTSKTEQYKNSIFVRTAINWNHLEDSVVCATTTEEFKSALLSKRD